MIRKVMIVLLCAAIMCPVGTLAESEDELYFESSEYSEAVRFLTAFGILDKESDSLDTSEWTISRGEFVHLALLCTGLSEYSDIQYAQSPFVDVNSDNPYYNDIIFSYKNDLFGKNHEKMFYPDSPLTTEFAAELGVNMTGRGLMVTASKTYLNLASSAKLFEDVEIYGKNKISRGGAFEFLKNVLTADLVTFDAINTRGEKKYIHVEKDSDLLSEALGYKKKYGVLTSDGLTTVYGDTPSPGGVTIDGNYYELLFNGAGGMAGKSVEYYVTDYNGEEAVKYIEEYKNDVIEVDADSIEKFDPANMSFNVLTENKNKELSISRSAYISYNHEPYYDPCYMVPQKGTVTFIDHNSDGIYDVVMILEFTNTVIDFYSDYSEIIYDVKSRKDAVGSNTDDIDLSLCKNVYITNEKNVTADPMSLEKYNIASVYKSAGKEKIKIIVSSEKTSGRLTAIDDDDVLTVGKNEYELSGDFRGDKNNLRVGEDYTFYFDAYGKIAYVSEESGIMAYLINADKGKRMSDKVKIQVLDESTGNLSVYELANKVRYRTPEYDIKADRKEVYEKYLIDASGDFIRGMSILTMNSQKEVTSIVTALNIETYEDLIAAPDYPLYKLKYLVTGRPTASGGDATGKRMEYKNAGRHFQRWIVMASGAKMFYVPQDNEKIDDPDGVTVKAVSYSNGSTEDADMEYYTKDRDEIAIRYMVKHAKASSDATLDRSWPYVITKITGCSDDKLGNTYRVSMQGAGETVTLLTKDDTVVLKENWAPDTDISKVPPEKKEIEVGDIVYYSTDASGNIASFLMWWNAHDGIKDLNQPRFGSEVIAAAPEKWGDLGPVGGIIERKDSSVIEISVDGTAPLSERIQRISWGAEQQTVLVDYSGKKTVTSTGIQAKELILGDRIVLCSRGVGQCYVAVVYRR